MLFLICTSYQRPQGDATASLEMLPSLFHGNPTVVESVKECEELDELYKQFRKVFKSDLQMLENGDKMFLFFAY